jgi:hypothetical protein
MVKLTSNDGQEFNVPKEVAMQSVLIKNMLEDIGDADDQPIPLPNVSAPILAKGSLSFRGFMQPMVTLWKTARPHGPWQSCAE